MKLSGRLKQKLAGINISSIAFFAVSIISITLAWFAYTNSVSSNMNINLKSWDVKVKKNNTELNNTFSININDLYPGMSDFSDTYTIHNNGDLDAKITYNITYFRIFDTEITTTNGISFAQLSRDYPFDLELSHQSRFLEAGSSSSFTVSCTWPFNSGNDALDTQYGQLAYDFYQNEQQLHAQDSSYIMRSGLELKIEIVISQYIDETNSFATDSWNTIELAVEKGDTSKYNVGDTKIVSMDVDGNGTNENYTVRIANKSTNSNCNNENYSQTACGFVVEFQDIITTMQMRDTYTNLGGYPATLVYSYLNNNLESYLPIDLQNVLAKTRVISGYGCIDNTNDVCNNPDNNGNNFISTNRLYLLSGKEVFGSNSYDTSASSTTQLEYYQISSRSKIKQYNSEIKYWWLRQPISMHNSTFMHVNSYGGLGYNISSTNIGVSPAFRIS